ncbi:MAG: wax ester/triacylglycerol synthase family O-acyltransferase [Candidatus Binatia bacterium]
MNDPDHTRLSGLDQSFLHFETPNAYMHVALTAIFEPGSLGSQRGGIDFPRIRRHVASRLHLIPRYRQCLHYTPILNEPLWVDDTAFDLEYHVRHSHLPAPGSDAQLKTLVARLLERPLDRRRPLWEATFIEGLPDGRFAMLIKIHHCLVDGIAGMDILAALLDPAPTTRLDPPEPWTPAPPPSATRLMRDEIRHRAAASFGALQRLPAMLASGGAEVGGRLAQLAGLVRTGLGRVADTSFNQAIGPHRRVEWVSFELEHVKEVKRRLGGTVNDVVLGIVGGGLRRVLRRAGDDTNGTLRALVPVSTRATTERGETGNRVSAWIADLPVDESRVLERHGRIVATTAALRSNQEEQATSLLVETAEWTPPIAIAMSVRLIRQVRLFNVIVTNIPGPAFPLHLQDARMVEGHPHVPLFDNQGLGIALLSYDGRLSLGLVADWDVVHDLAQVADDMEAAFKELCDAAGMKERAEIAAPARAEPVADLQSGADVRTSRREPSGHKGAEEPVRAHAH